ncbi:YegS/Rv2252/BmrU family lipid kinase [Flavobacterium sp.]|uniref:diacylglycerol/lipid kinase family protein n=1 Tax=Flavobacterium sp. TaxID=239 RepID=UPI00248A0C08|nr:YegS/Rv2252/BmrU family lipid kinase [Flavobacterium sp.]MDI1315802.1 YegS/Rv2252/BmrU family lipid kinase [Flavobacterium sp.]
MATKKKYVLIVNPISGDMDKSEILLKTLALAEEYKIEIIVYETSGKSDEKAIKKLYDLHKPERILITGGDGTIKMVAEALEDKDVIIGILPAGSTNGLSVDLNLPATIEENLAVAFHNHFMEIDMISINGKKSIHLSDLGLNAELVRNYENSSTRGKLGYALQVVTTLTELEEPFLAKIKTEDQTIECSARMIVIANSQKYGTGVTINPEGKMNDGRFEIVILKNLDLLVFGKILTGNIPLNSEDVEIISTDKATITTNKPVPFQIDGEYIGQETKLDIKILPAQMKFAVP